MYKLKKRSSRGFTLLELLLVLAILSTIMIAVFNTIKSRALEAQVQRTAVQMQLWLQSSLAFYSEQNFWPLTLKDIVTGGYIQGDIPGTTFTPYLNGWGGAYFVEPGVLTQVAAPGASAERGINLGAGRMFAVGTVVPTLAWAERLAAKLPTAVAYPNALPPTQIEGRTVQGYMVSAYVPIPGRTNQPGRLQSFGVYRVGENALGSGANIENDNNQNNKVRVKVPACPVHWAPRIIYGLVDFRYSKDNQDYPYYQQKGGRQWASGGADSSAKYRETGYPSFDLKNAKSGQDYKKFYPVNYASVKCEMQKGEDLPSPEYVLSIETQGITALRGSSMVTDYMAADASLSTASFVSPGLWFDMPYGNGQNAVNLAPGDVSPFQKFRDIDRQGDGHYTLMAFCSDSTSSHDSSNCPVKTNAQYWGQYRKGTPAVWQGPYIDPYLDKDDPRTPGNDDYWPDNKSEYYTFPRSIQFGGPKFNAEKAGAADVDSKDYAGVVYLPDVFAGSAPLPGKQGYGEEWDPFNRAPGNQDGVSMDLETTHGYGGALFVATKCVPMNESSTNVDSMVRADLDGGFKVDACNDPNQTKDYRVNISDILPSGSGAGTAY